MAHNAARAASQTRVRVVAAALFDVPSSGEGRSGLTDRSRRVLIAQRPPGKPMAGRWEFPGGKVAPGETDLQALRRELREELGIEVIGARHCMTLTHTYADRAVELSMWIVDRYGGEPEALEGQQTKWVALGQLGAEDILEADRPFIEALQAAPEPGLGPERAPGLETGDMAPS